MSLDPKLHFAVFELLRASLLRIRDAGWRGDAARCAIEADHVHNLPGLLESGEFDLAKFYWNTERAAFIHQLATSLRKGWVLAEI